MPGSLSKQKEPLDESLVFRLRVAGCCNLVRGLLARICPTTGRARGTAGETRG